MKQILLSAFLTLFTTVAFSQNSPDGSGSAAFSHESYFEDRSPISIYPNPATDYISVDNDENVKQITVFNLVGRKLLSFDNVKMDERYDVTDLPKGMYLVRVIDYSNKIITTQRISKR